MMTFILSILCGFFESCWRRVFGGKDCKYKVFEIRGVQHVINCLFLAAVFTYKFWFLPTWWILALSVVYMTIIWEIEFWTRAHGPQFDEGRDINPTSYTIKRYERQWFCHYLLTPLYNKMGWTKYKFSYDFVSMAMRYTFPCLWLTPFYGWNILWIGALVSPIYSFCWQFKELENNRYGSTQLAEYIVGALVGFGLMFLPTNGWLLTYLKVSNV